MALHLRSLLRVVPGLVRNPFALDLGIEFLHSVVDTPLARLAFRQMLIGVGARERAFLESLTRAPLDLEALARLPEDTLGAAYSRFYAVHGFDPDYHARVCPPSLDDLERDWVFARFARLHDLHHVLLGIGVTPREEIALHLLLFVNARDPVASIFVAGMPYLAARYLRRDRFWSEARRVVRAARALPNLFRFPYEERMAEPLADLRVQIGLPAEGHATAW